MISNSVFNLLCDLGVCDPARVLKIQDFVRDRNDIAVYRCERSGVIFLDQTEHMREAHYVSKSSELARMSVDRQRLVSDDDTVRRYAELKNRVRGKRWLDFGTGPGSVLDCLGPLAKSYAAVELQRDWVELLSDLGHKVYSNVDDVPGAAFDVITLFHVFEHLIDPASLLTKLKSLLKTGGRVFVEVPHAEDALISVFNCSEFKAHTFWSEHLILHTRQSITALSEYCGFEVISIKGVQRYPLANHLHWLSKGMPGGHEVWSFLRDELLDRCWADVLAAQNATDTLFAELRLRDR